MTRLACVSFAALLVAASAIVLDVQLSASVANVAGAGFVPLTFTATVTTDDMYNLTQLCVVPYVNGLQWGGDACVLRQEASNTSQTVVAGDFVLQIPVRLQQTTACISVAVQGVPQGPSVGTAPPAVAVVSNSVCIGVGAVPATRRRPLSPTAPKLGLYFEPWFTPLNFWWAGGVMWAEAIPSVGRYGSFTPDVALQQAYWFMRTGVAVVGTDWTNNLWGMSSWAQRAPNVQELVNATQLVYGVWAAAARDLGWALPTQTLLLGLDNGPTTPLSAIEEEMDFIESAVLTNASLAGLWESHAGGPLIVLFDGSGASHAGTSYKNWTIRWMASQNQNTGANTRGYWSWMDGVVQLPITVDASGGFESATATPAFFENNGWTGVGAVGHAGGLTWLREIASVVAATTAPGAQQPSLGYLWTCQLNEFAGQANGNGYGPSHDVYVDIYSSELGNDIEPTSLTACAYRRPGVACGGWGYRYLNLLALVSDVLNDLQALDDSALLFLVAPATGDVSNYSDARNASVTVAWNVSRFNSATPGAWMAPVALPVAISIDGAPVATAPAGASSALLPLPPTLDRRYPHRLSVCAQPAAPGDRSQLTRYPLSLDVLDENVPLADADMVPACADVMMHLPEAVHW